MTQIPNTLTIAGSDSGGGAGIQADLKSFSANRTFGASVLTALTAQNTQGVTAVHDVPTEFISAQMDAVFSDIDIHAVKIGMLSQVAVIETVRDSLEKHNAKNIVFDPVMVTTSGDPLLADDAVDAVKSVLMPVADLITPNLHEAAKLTGQPLATTNETMILQAQQLLDEGAKAVLVKGGHSENDQCADLLKTPNDELWISAERIDTQNTHGTGCSLSSAIASHLAHGATLQEAVKTAKAWLTGAIAHSDELNVGEGSGPIHHFHNLWSK
jgi:hydroxymethylpyrimidine/phosphomethylpyrimidine kinase